MDNPDVAAAQLKKYRKQIDDNQMLAFFDGQLAYLRKDYATSVEKMQQVFNDFRTDSSASPALARFALGRIRQVLMEQQLAEQVRKAAELTLRRSGLSHYDEIDMRGDARSLLNVLEADDHRDRRPSQQEGPAVRVDIDVPTTTPPSQERSK